MTGTLVRRLFRRLVMIAVGFASACQAEPSTGPVVLVEDSAGVRVVHVPGLQEVDLPTWKTEELYTTAGGASAIQLDQVTDGLFLQDKSLLVANAGSGELLQFDSLGNLARRIGRRGEGPGEFSPYLMWLGAATDRSFWAFDGRLTRFDYSGQLLDTRRVDAAWLVGAVRPLAVLSDGRMVSVLGTQTTFGRDGGERRDTVPLFVVDSDDSRADTVATWLGLERAFAKTAAGMALVPIGFGRTVFYGADADRVVIGSTDSLDITVFRNGTEVSLRLHGPAAGRPVSAHDERDWRQWIVANSPLKTGEFLRAWESAPVRATYPAFDGLEMDPLGRLWVGDYVLPTARTRRWIVFGADGTPIGTVELPFLPPKRLPGRTELLALGADRVAVLQTNEWDEESVAVLLVKSK